MSLLVGEFCLLPNLVSDGGRPESLQGWFIHRNVCHLSRRNKSILASLPFQFGIIRFRRRKPLLLFCGFDQSKRTSSWLGSGSWFADPPTLPFAKYSARFVHWDNARLLVFSIMAWLDAHTWTVSWAGYSQPGSSFFFLILHFSLWPPVFLWSLILINLPETAVSSVRQVIRAFIESFDWWWDFPMNIQNLLNPIWSLVPSVLMLGCATSISNS